MKKNAVLGVVLTLVCAGLPACAQISVTEASYGLNRGNNQAGNATQYVKAECDGKRSCDFPVSKAASQVGDHFPGLTKDFDVRYSCGSTAKTGHVDGESNGKSILLTCQ